MQKYDICLWSKILVESFPNLCWSISHAVLNNDRYIELTLENKQNSRFPLIITMFEYEGIFMDLGKKNTVIEMEDNCNDHIKQLVNDILYDKIIVAAGYENEDKYLKQDSWMSRCWAVSVEDEFAEYEAYVKRLSTRLSFWEKISPYSSKGIIEISDWSGKRYQKIIRK